MDCPKCGQRMKVEGLDPKTKKEKCRCGHVEVTDQRGRKMLTELQPVRYDRVLKG